MKTELTDERTPAAFLSPAEHPPVGLFRTVLKNRSFLLLWLIQLLSQTAFNAANYGVIAVVTAVTHSTVLVGIALVSFTLPAEPFSLLAGAGELAGPFVVAVLHLPVQDLPIMFAPRASTKTTSLQWLLLSSISCKKSVVVCLL